MGGSVYWQYEVILEWTIVLSVGASGICMLVLAILLFADRCRMWRKGQDAASHGD